jgi:AraC family ethanolamine operon transcriptional activator
MASAAAAIAHLLPLRRPVPFTPPRWTSTRQRRPRRTGESSRREPRFQKRNRLSVRVRFESKGAPLTEALLDAEPRVASMVFCDFDEFSASNGVLDIEFLQLASSPVDSRMLRVALDRMLLMRGWENTPYLTRSSNPAGTSTLLFLLETAGSSLWRGHEVGERSLLSYQRDAEHVGRSTGGAVWAAIFFQTAALAEASIALRGAPPATYETGAAFLEPGSAEMDGLRSAVQQAFRIAESAPQLIETASVRRSVEDTILAAAVAAIDPPRERTTPEGPLISHQRVVSRAEDALAASINAPIYVQDLCRAAGVSERTLRNAFQSLYHVAPIRLLHLRRLHQVRSALRCDARTSVTEVALRFGFGNLGRFAVEYRQLFGESPSHTRKRSAQ